MDVLELLEEIDRLDEPYYKGYICKYDVQDIIRNHFLDARKMVDGWIPVEEGLPEVNKIVKVTVHSSEWISDFDSSWVPEEEKRRHPEAYKVYDGYIDESGKWVVIDEEFSENICEGSFGEDKGRIYDVVIAWQPRPEPYKIKKDIPTAKNTQQEMEDFWRDK